MHLHPAVAPYKAAVLPLSKKLGEKAMEIVNQLCKDFSVTYDETGSIGKRYRRQDAIGTPFTICVDDETVNNNTITIRDRDTVEQITLPVDEVAAYIESKIKF
jgi:glycyl-tRNA synthetase